MKKRFFAALSVIIMIMPFVACARENEQQNAEYIEQESSTYASLAANEAGRFSNADLTFDNVRAGMTPEEVKTALGEPDADNLMAAEANPERIFVYNGAGNAKSTLVFWSVGGVMQLCGVECTDPSRKLPRNTRVGMNADDVRDLFYRDADCLNANVMSEDNATILGKFLYGDMTLDKLEEKKVTEKLEYGMINYNGKGYMEQGEVILEYMCMEPPFAGEFAGYNDDYSQLMYYTDSEHRVARVCWYYYPEVS